MRRSTSIGSPSSRMKPALKIFRPRPGHGQIVDGAVDGQFPNIAAGEEQRMDDERVGGHRQTFRPATAQRRRRGGESGEWRVEGGEGRGEGGEGRVERD